MTHQETINKAIAALTQSKKLDQLGLLEVDVAGGLLVSGIVLAVTGHATEFGFMMFGVGMSTFAAAVNWYKSQKILDNITSSTIKD